MMVAGTYVLTATYTPSGSQGLPVHHDTHEVISLQVAGEKRWLVYEPAWELPLKDQRYSEAEQMVRRVPDSFDGFAPGLLRDHDRHRLRREEGTRWQGEQQELAGQAVFEQGRHPGSVCRFVVFAFHGSP